jgi:hypothetical protein
METDIDRMSNDEFQQFKSERYARQLVWHAFFPEVENLEENEHAKHIYEQLKADLAVVFNEIPPVSDRCHVCGKMRKEPTKELRADQLAERFHEAYERLAPQFDYKTRKETAVPWAQVPEQNRLLMIAVCADLLSGHVVLAPEAASKG